VVILTLGLSIYLYSIAPSSYIGVVAGNSINNIFPLWLLLSFVFLFLFNLVLNYIFSMGLIKVEEVRFAKISGIFNLIINIFVTLILIFLIYAVFFNLFIFLTLYSVPLVTFSSVGLFFLLLLLIRLFEPLTLLNASRKFEN
jgi:hypothetical protein